MPRLNKGYAQSVRQVTEFVRRGRAAAGEREAFSAAGVGSHADHLFVPVGKNEPLAGAAMVAG